MRRYIRELRPTSVYDLAAMVALYGGPMDNIPAYIRQARAGARDVPPPLPRAVPEKTYGIFVYQEDIMAAAMALGEFTGPEPTRSAMRSARRSRACSGRRRRSSSAGRGAGRRPRRHRRGVPAFEPFEQYRFNKAHATCYGLIAYQTAYLKANHTVDYMAAVLTAFRANEGRSRRPSPSAAGWGSGPAARRPFSHLEFAVEGDAIRFGLLAVKNVGQARSDRSSRPATRVVSSAR